MPKHGEEVGKLLASLVEIAFRPANNPTQTDARRKAEQMITLLDKGNKAAAEKLAGAWTDSERRAVQAELARL